MLIPCNVYPRRDAAPCELMELGAALHRWYARERREYGLALYTNGEAIAALQQGTLPALASYTRIVRDRRAVPLAVRGGACYSREATIESLRRDIPGRLVDDVLLDGKSWSRDA